MNRKQVAYIVTAIMAVLGLLLLLVGVHNYKVNNARHAEIERLTRSASQLNAGTKKLSVNSNMKIQTQKSINLDAINSSAKKALTKGFKLAYSSDSSKAQKNLKLRLSKILAGSLADHLANTVKGQTAQIPSTVYPFSKLLDLQVYTKHVDVTTKTLDLVVETKYKTGKYFTGTQQDGFDTKKANNPSYYTKDTRTNFWTLTYHYDSKKFDFQSYQDGKKANKDGSDSDD